MRNIRINKIAAIWLLMLVVNVGRSSQPSVPLE